ncbi:MAG TPA: hypothetical protein VG755_28090 [Nannocystaceae bacterium]|nr:hypothetical protein [Nannocystaceae bacterium]
MTRSHLLCCVLLLPACTTAPASTPDSASTSDAGSDADGSSSSAASEATTNAPSDSSGAPDDSPSGSERWRSTLGPGRAAAVAVAQDDHSVVVGTDDPFGGRAWAIAVDPDGAVQWKRVLAQPDGHAQYNDVAIAPSGDVWVVGYRARSILGPAYSIVLERLDPGTGDVVFADPGQDVDLPANSGAALESIVVLDDGPLVAGMRIDDATGEARPTLWRYDHDGVLAWATSWPVHGVAYDVAVAGDVAIVVGATLDGSDPVGAWAGIAALDDGQASQPSLPSGRAELRLAVRGDDEAVWAIGSSFGKNEHGFDAELGGMFSIAVSGELGAAVELPAQLRGAALREGGELVVVDDDGRVRGIALDATITWELDDSIAVRLTNADALAIASDGDVLVAGGFDTMELAKIAPPA